jgi:hypothetical protein
MTQCLTEQPVCGGKVCCIISVITLILVFSSHFTFSFKPPSYHIGAQKAIYSSKYISLIANSFKMKRNGVLVMQNTTVVGKSI